AKLRELGDYLKDKAQDAVSILFSPSGEKVSILCVVGRELLPRYNAGRIVNAVASELGGKGGGRPDSAMAGGSGPDKIPALLEKLPDIVRSTV
ncbi:MAG: DHHA1 domain-containing protein, partial [Candidatus Syntrophosphaera sp.]